MAAENRKEETFPRIKPCGDRALTVIVGDRIDPKVNDKVYALYTAIKAAPMDGLLDMVPSFASLLICFDPDKTSFFLLKDRLLDLEKQLSLKPSPKKALIWNVPCCYSRRFSPDLESVADHAGMSAEEVVARHSGGLYRIYMLGFLPGFVYLGGLDPAIACPRLKTPRKKIPRGAVGIGGSQTGIYPLDSPGGWRLIGSTPVPMYDPCRADPVLCRPGDFIRFVPITTCQYYDIARDVTNRSFKAETEEYRE